MFDHFLGQHTQKLPVLCHAADFVPNPGQRFVARCSRGKLAVVHIRDHGKQFLEAVGAAVLRFGVDSLFELGTTFVELDIDQLGFGRVGQTGVGSHCREAVNVFVAFLVKIPERFGASRHQDDKKGPVGGSGGLAVF
ncbi:MAG TPA: hypothetical protein DCF49_05130 [Lachnospiraceae bacterium]|nr:hypothetical protein [Lachnospiraceae bacterium]